MNNHLAIRLTSAGLLILAAIALWSIQTDRLMLQLIPTPGAANALVADSSSTYEQTIVVTQKTISRIGIFFSASGSLPSVSLPLRVYRGEQLIGEANTSSLFLDNDGTTLWQFSQSIKTNPGEKIRLRLTIPAELSEKIRLKIRVPDGEFNIQDIQFLLNGKLQPNPLGYEAYAQYQPPLAIALAALAFIAAIHLLIHPKKQISRDLLTIGASILACAAYLAPTLWHGTFPWPLLFTSTAVFLGSYWWLEGKHLHPISALGGASVLAFTTWWVLQYASERSAYLLIAAIPLLFVTIQKNQPKERKVVSGALAVLMVIGVVSSGITWTTSFVPTAANPKDALFDTQQAVYSLKVVQYNGEPISWDNFGAYVGIPAGVLILIGLIPHLKARKYLWATAILVSIIAFTPAIASLSAAWHLPVASPHLVIFLILAFAVATAHGIENLYTYLGYHDRLARILVTGITLLMILDLWNVSANVLETLT